MKKLELIRGNELISNKLIKALEREIDLLQKGKGDLTRSRAITKIAGKVLYLKRLEIRKEGILLSELLKTINKLKK